MDDASLLSSLMILSLNERIDLERKLLFETLESGDVKFFCDKCDKIEKEYNIQVILNARDSRLGFEGRTLLHNASRYSHSTLGAVQYLIQKGSNVDATDSSVSLITPLMDAILANSVNAAICLVQAGANLFAQDMSGENALHYCARNGSTIMINKILQAAELSPMSIQELASQTNVKLKFPEDITKSQLCREVLQDYRTSGHHIIKPKKRTQDKRRNE